MAQLAKKNEVFPRNLIRVAVAEVRFPALLAIPEPAVGKAQKGLRKRYPEYSKQRAQSSAPEEPGEVERHLFKSRGGDWTVVLKNVAFALESKRYLSFDDFLGRFGEVCDVFVPLLDADYATRVGLRYIDDIPIGNDDPEGWVRDELLGLQRSKVLPGIVEVIQGVTGKFEDCEYKFRHGVLQDEEGRRVYRLDADYFTQDVDIGILGDVIAKLHDHAYQTFEQCLGGKALDYMRAKEAE